MFTRGYIFDLGMGMKAWHGFPGKNAMLRISVEKKAFRYSSFTHWFPSENIRKPWQRSHTKEAKKPG